MKHVVMFSGGIGSWATAKRVAEQHGADDLVLLFADVKGFTTDPHIGEDEDTYRFIEDAAENVGGELVIVRDGRNIWEVFRDDRFLGNARLANCSKFLKQRPSRAWLEEHCPGGSAHVYVGIDWTETHRLPAIQAAYLPYIAHAPLTEPPFLDKQEMIAWAESEGLKPPRLYAAGYAHNNCGGGCVRAGQGQFKKLLEQNPERFAVWEREEQKLRDHLGKDVAILRDRSKEGIDAYMAKQPEGTKRVSLVPLTLRAFRERVQGNGEVEQDEIGGCGCFVDDEASAQPVQLELDTSLLESFGDEGAA
ncbi:phosphoadenosine phosphosulfate reductase [Mycobacterium phage Nhonho]|uniref:phosphoadenosine phosphosulfate reductase n=1 Tax=Mycobacterium phage Nhonho TaxID=1675553 RepID=UPI0006A2E4EC|nr:phosphoadenosine phosphosulfate reductase [Mycobacterium phage Nhonho]AKU45478.1 PAPS reductase domain protein [Mycobacterium phage Nhonho]